MLRSRREALTRLLAVVALSAAGASPLAGAAAAEPDAARLARLARDVDRVESVRAVKRLQHGWALYVDLGEWDRAAGLFGESAELAHGDDRFHGRAAIRDYFRRVIGKGTAALPEKTVHAPFLMSPIVTLADDGMRAKGRWHAFSMRGSFGGEASWQGGIFENEYVREGGAWRIARQIFSPTMIGPYESGWRATRPALPLVPYHFLPADIGKPFVLGAGVPAGAHEGASLPELAARIAALRDEDAVRNLQHAWGYYQDFKMWDDVVELFEPTARVEVGGVGEWRGSDNIRRWLETQGSAGLRWGEVNDRIQPGARLHLLQGPDQACVPDQLKTLATVPVAQHYRVRRAAEGKRVMATVGRADGVFVVAGGSRGIGAAISVAAAEAGYAVLLTYASNARAAQDVVSRIEAAGGTARAVRADTALPGDIAALFAEADAMGRLAVLAYSGGITGAASPLADAAPDEIARVIAVNLTGAMLCAREAIVRMSTARGGVGGAIVFLSSRASDYGSPGEHVWYAASKGGIDSLTRGLAREVGKEGIRVNAVSPGPVATDMLDPAKQERAAGLSPIGRIGTPEEIAAAVMFMASAEASFVTGANLAVSGGR